MTRSCGSQHTWENNEETIGASYAHIHPLFTSHSPSLHGEGRQITELAECGEAGDLEHLRWHQRHGFIGEALQDFSWTHPLQEETYPAWAVACTQLLEPSMYQWTLGYSSRPQFRLLDVFVCSQYNKPEIVTRWCNVIWNKGYTPSTRWYYKGGVM